MSYNTLLFTKGNCAKVLDVKSWEIEHITESNNPNEVLVLLKNSQVKRVSVAQAGKHFVESRKERAKFLKTQQHHQHGRFWMVSSSGGKGSYQVELKLDKAICNCEDYKNQIEAFNGRAACKHVYAVLTELGCSSLSEYINGWKEGGKAFNLKQNLAYGCRPEKDYPKHDSHDTIKAEANYNK
ncbi:MAG: hypothetical protein VKK42_25820 [Lyngbya sp.]|nr:hypothetical protein [Lyngbya sp.]